MRNLLLFIMLFVFFAGCAGRLNYQVLDAHMKADRCPAAVEYVKTHEHDYGQNQRLLFLLDSAMVNMLCGNYEASNRYFHSAEDLADELWTKSFTKETASYLVNDYTIPYAGEEFEKALINLFSAVNYARLENRDEALVEIRRLDANLRALNDRYEKKNVYKEDAFARYLSGILYESDNNLNDAFIDYYNAYKIFEDYRRDYNTPVPRILLEDLFRTADATGRTDEVRLIDGASNIKWMKQEETGGLGKIVIIHFNGKSPVKKDTKVHIPTKDGPVTFAFPKYEVHRPRCRDIKVSVQSESHKLDARTELVEDINEIAVKNLEDRKGRVIVKMVARAAAKQASIRKLTKDKDVRRLLNIANTIIETADTRTWRTLPGEIYLSRIMVPEGKYFVNFSQCRSEHMDREHVDIKAGETKFVLFEAVY